MQETDWLAGKIPLLSSAVRIVHFISNWIESNSWAIIWNFESSRV